MPRSAINDYQHGKTDGLEAAAQLLERQDWPMFGGSGAVDATKAQAWLVNAIRKLKK